MAQDKKIMDETKASQAESEESKASAEGDLSRTIKSLATSDDKLKRTRATCMQVAAQHETTVPAREEELKVIADAKKILSGSSSGAVSQTYNFLQVTSRTE